MIAGAVLQYAHGTVVAVDVVEPDAEVWSDLHPDERDHGESLAVGRRKEWVAGRRALRRALRLANGAAEFSSHAITTSDRGAPKVPAGMVGSLSHKRALAVALAARDEGWTVGVDLETDEPRRIDIARKVMTPAELDALACVGAAERDRVVTRAFAIKEAVYKAIDPFLRRYVGFLEVEVWPASDGSVVVIPLVEWGLELEAAWYGDGVHLVCTARARRR